MTKIILNKPCTPAPPKIYCGDFVLDNRDVLYVLSQVDIGIVKAISITETDSNRKTDIGIKFNTYGDSIELNLNDVKSVFPQGFRKVNVTITVDILS